MFIALWKVEQNTNKKNHTTIQQEMGITFGNCHYITCNHYHDCNPYNIMYK
jgi:hypothetical protein